MASFKLTYFFKTTSGNGWSESYYYSGSESTVATDATTLANNRLLLLPQDAVLIYCRISTPVKREVDFVDFYGPGGGAPGQWPTNSENSNLALYCRVTGSQTSFGKLYLRTVPLDQVTEGAYVPSAAWQKTINSFENFLMNGATPGNQFSIFSNIPNEAGAYVITSIQPTLPRGYQFVAGHGLFTVGHTIRVSRCAVYGYNGDKVVQAVVPGDTTDAVFVGGASPGAPDPETYSPQAVIYSGVLEAITGFFPTRLTTRRTGRFFGEQVGRRPNRISLRR